MEPLKKRQRSPSPGGGNNKRRKKAKAPTTQRVLLKAAVWRIRITRPAPDSVWLVGDSIPLEAVATRNGVVQNVTIEWSVQGGVFQQAPLRIEPDRNCTYTIRARIQNRQNIQHQIQCRAIRPILQQLKLGAKAGAGTRYDLYSHCEQSRKAPLWRRGAGSQPYGYAEPDPGVRDDADACPLPHPACFQLGSEITVRAGLVLRESLTAPASIDLAGIAKNKLPAWGPKPKRAAYAGKIFGFVERDVPLQQSQWVDLEGSCPLPFAVGAYDLSGNWSYRVQRQSDGQPSDLIPLAKVERLMAYCIYDAPQIGGSLREDQFDAFHVAKATRWGVKCWNLKHESFASVPFKVSNMLRHYGFPAGYDNMKEKRVAWWRTQKKPKTRGDQDGSLFYPPTEDNEPFGGDKCYGKYFRNNSGWALLDNPTHPGGRCNQQAGLIVSVLNTLGVSAEVHEVLPKTDGGWLIMELHDLPAGDCFEELDDWLSTWNFHGIVKVPGQQGDARYHEQEDTYYDSSFSTPPGSWPPDSTSWLAEDCKRHGMGDDSLRTGRDLKPRGDKLVNKGGGNNCFCPHPPKSGKTSRPHSHGMRKTAKACGQCKSPPAVRYRCVHCGTDIPDEAIGDLEEGTPWIDGRCRSCNELYVGLWCEMIYRECGCGAVVGDVETCYNCNAAPP